MLGACAEGPRLLTSACPAGRPAEELAPAELAEPLALRARRLKKSASDSEAAASSSMDARTWCTKSDLVHEVPGLGDEVRRTW